MIRNMFNGSVFFNIFSTPTVFTNLFDTFVTCGFQFRCLFRFMPKKLKLSTNSISVPFIFIVVTILFSAAYGTTWLWFSLRSKIVYSFLAILLRFLIPFQCFQYQSALQLFHTRSCHLHR